MKFKNMRIKQGQKVIIDGIDGTIPANGIVTVIGQNGVGKTTLLRALAGLLPFTGSIEDKQAMTYLPQQNQFYDAVSVVELLALVETAEDNLDWVQHVFTSLDIAELLPKNVISLSGVQQQRVWLAFILIQAKPILVFDEPLTYLDFKYQKRFLKLISEVSKNITIIQVIHDLNIANQHSDFIWLLTQKQLIIGTPKQVLTLKNLQLAFATEVKIEVTENGQRWFAI